MMDILQNMKESCPLFFALLVVVLLFWQNRFLRHKIKDYKELTEMLCFERDYDILSGLKNRNAFLRYFQQMEESELKASVLVCDIDGLKLINDAAGHAAGNDVIQKAAELLRRACPPEASTFRTGGDEYVILLPEDWTEKRLQVLKEKIQEEINCHNKKSLHTPLSLSIGYAAGAGFMIGVTYNQADSAMYREKRQHQEKAYEMLRLALDASK